MTSKEFKPEAVISVCNHGGVEVMMNPSGDKLYYRWNYGQDMENEEIFEAHIKYGYGEDEGRAYFTSGGTMYYLDQLLKV
jgi:hypothetical protein